MEIRELSERLSRQADSVVRYLLPQGVQRGNEYVAGSVNGEKGDSLRVHLTGAKAGVWADFAAQQKGDLIELWRLVKGLTLVQALRQIEDYLGVATSTLTPAKRKTYEKPPKPRNLKPITDNPDTADPYKYLTSVRKISSATLEAYRVRLGVYGDKKTPCYLFPMNRDEQLVNVKYVTVALNDKGKHDSWSSPGCELSLIGWHIINSDAREVLITEGQWDMLAWYEYGYPALSVPNGANAAWVENEYDNLDRFETIYLSFDNDEAGTKAAQIVIDRLGRHRCKIISLPYKDANKCLQEGVTREEMATLVEQAELVQHELLKPTLAYEQAVYERFYPTVKRDFDPPWKKLQGKLAWRPGELSVWAGYTNHGKTTFLSQVLLHAIEQEEKVCLASLEVSPAASLEVMVRQATGKALPRGQHVAKALCYLEDKLWFYDAITIVTPESILDAWLYARRKYNIRQFALDNLMCVGIAEDDYPAQKVFVNKLREFAIIEDVHVHLVHHMRKGENDSHVRSSNVRGSASITALAHNVIMVSRDIENQLAVSKLLDAETSVPQDLLDKPDGYLTCDKQRNGTSWIGSVAFWFDSDSKQYLERLGNEVAIYVRES